MDGAKSTQSRPKGLRPAERLRRSETATRLTGHPLVVARAACLTIIALVVALLTAAVPARYTELQTTFQNLSPAQEAVLIELGLKGVLNADARLTLEILVIAGFVGTGLLIVIRRPDEWVALHVAAALTLYVAWIVPPLDALAASAPPWQVLGRAVQALALVAALQFFYVFPDGRFVPGWTRLLVVLSAICGVGWVLLPNSAFDLANPYRLSLPSFALLMAWWATGIGAQLYRFARVAGPIQRQQTKWILFGTATGIVAYLIFGIDRFALPALREARLAGVVYDLVGVPLFLLVVLVVPIAFAISIFHYRLWDIDIIISRAFVYGTSTAILAGAYIASITLLQRLFVALTGEKSDAAIVGTTLIAAALVTPLKNRLERMNERWMKRPFGPNQALKTFADQLRIFLQLMDVDQLTSSALDRAMTAFGAGSGAVYLQKHGHYQLAHRRGEWTQIEGLGAPLENTAGTRYGWIVLGPAADGRDYTSDDEAKFDAMAALVSQAIAIIDQLHAPGGSAEHRQTGPLFQTGRLAG